MSFEAITDIAKAEDAAKNAVEFAQAQAKQMLSDAEQQGKARMAELEKKAADELSKLKEMTDKKSLDEAADLAKAAEGIIAELKSAAGEKIEEAAKIVVERIVMS